MKNHKKGKTRKTGHHGPLRRSEGHPCYDVALRRSEGCLTEARLKGQKAPSPGLPRRSPATPRQSASLQRSNATAKSLFTVGSFRIFVSEHLVFVPR